MKKIFAGLFLCLLFTPLPGNAQQVIQRTFSWNAVSHFEGAVSSDERPGIPFALERLRVNGPGRIRIEVLDSRFEEFEKAEEPQDTLLGADLNFYTEVYRERSQFYAKVAFCPIIRVGGRYRRLQEIRFRAVLLPDPPRVGFRSPEFASRSQLSQGSVYKFYVRETGIHKLSYAFLQEELGVELNNIDPANIRLLGNGGGMLPTDPAAERPDDLIENAIWIAGAADGRFDPDDYILFYAQGADRWRYDGSRELFVMDKNIYDDRNFYFLQIGAGPGKRLAEQASSGLNGVEVNAFDDYARYEEDRLNLLHEWPTLAQGSGQRWYADHFRNARTKDYPELFTFPGRQEGEPVRILAEMALRAAVPSRFQLNLNGEVVNSTTARRVWTLTGPGANEINYADSAVVDAAVTVAGPSLNFTVTYAHPSGNGDGSEGWVDFIQVNVRRALRMVGDQMSFRDTRSLGAPNAVYQLGEASEDLAVWDISDPHSPRLQLTVREGNTLRFGADATSLKHFVALDPGGDFAVPEAVGPIGNQNLHALDAPDLVIVYHEDFRDAAEALAQHRRQHSGLAVETAPADQVYNEFSSGRRDPGAIRDLAHMLHLRGDRFRYLLLMGDGSFDNRDIYGLGTNFLPVFETRSFNPIYAYPSDDYFALFDGGSPEPLDGNLRIGCGRLPVKTPEEAMLLVEKIIQYDLNPASYGNWRNTLVFVGDDEDSMTHTRQADQIADTLLNRYPFFNIDKLYLDAYPQVSTAGGARVPGLTEALNQAIFRGSLVTTYLGHGGAQGWAQERVLSISDINSWENAEKPTLLLTATCQFAGFDDPAFVSAGEEALLHSGGGAIALFTTVRAVFSSYNRELTEKALNVLVERPNGDVQAMGEIMRRAKNDFTFPGQITNARKFALLGDPSQKPALPHFEIRTTSIDGQEVPGSQRDTLRALQQVTVSGEVTDASGQRLEDFNGIVYPTIYDKKVKLETLGQDRGSFAYPYTLQKNIVFRGRASANAGRFTFTFVVPKDINFELGPGKISYYAAENGRRIDATGQFDDFLIGEIDRDGLADDRGPRVDVFMNSDGFAFGGITNASPTLLVELEDDNGINVVGNSIGHDLEAVLDEDTQNAILLNDFYESELDDHRRGSVRYPLSKLSEGRHSLRVKAWDVANNPAEGYTEFVVASSEGIALRHVLNYPNPFTDRTCFQFDHNLPGQELQVLVQIYTISGRLVKTLEETLFSDGALRQDDCIAWDGLDDYGDRLARGVYLYRVQVRSVQPGSGILSGESAFEKLVLLK